VSALVLAAALGTATRADAQPASEGERSAAAIFDEARAAFAKKDYGTAARKFEEANRRAPRGQTEYNAAMAWEAAADLARAADGFASALEDPALPPAARDHARERVTAIERVVLTLHVEARETATATIAHAVDRPLPATLHVAPGRHELVVRFQEGGVVRQEIEARAAERVTLKVSPPALADARPASAAPAPSTGTALTPPPAPTADSPPVEVEPGASRRSLQPTLGWVALGASAVSLGAAVYLGVSGVDARDRFDASGETDADARSSAITLRTWANVAWVAAGAFAATSLVLMVTAPRRASPGPSVSLGIGAVSGSF
jgi:hypothetical protein